MIGAAARELVAGHLAAGALCAVVTATNSFVTAPIAREFGVAAPGRDGAGDAAATRSPANRRGMPCFREGKVARLEQWLAAIGRRARELRGELVLQRLAQRPAAARTRHTPGRRRSRRHAPPDRRGARLAGHFAALGCGAWPRWRCSSARRSRSPRRSGSARWTCRRGSGCDTIAGHGSDTSREIVWGLRAPRALAAFACGALLAVAGTLLQVLLRNPLADPTILGVSGGAAVGAMVGLLLAWPGWAVHAAALAGACAAAGALLALSLRPSGWNIHRVLLTGVAIGAGCGAIVSLLLALAPPGRLHGMLFWLLGDLSGAEHPLAPWVAAVVVVADSQVLAPRSTCSRSARQGALARRRGRCDADGGVPRGHGRHRGGGPRRGEHRFRRAGRAARAAARRVRRPPASGAARGARRRRLLTAADTLARTVVAPVEFPVGAITALVGVPVLLALLARTR